MKNRWGCLRAAGLLVSVTMLSSALEAAPVRILILTGQTVHDTATTTPFLESMYAADAARFKVVGVIDDVSTITSETFAGCDVIVSNWTCHPIMTGGPWTSEGKQAFGDAIRKGKGMVSFHAASAACNDWGDFQEISGLSWKLDHTGHTAYHTFKVVINDNQHPITRGMTDFWTTDELYQRMVKLGESPFRTLAGAFADTMVAGSGAWEPMLIIAQLGKGRGVNFLLGHDVHAMRNVAWQTIMLRSTEWAGTGKVTVPIPARWPSTPAAAAIVGVDLDATLRTAAQYAHGGSREALLAIQRYVEVAISRSDKSAADDRSALAGKLGEAVSACTTAEAGAFFCSQLAIVGTPREVEAIVPLLSDRQSAPAAREALERIAGAEAARALREAAGTLQGELRIGVIQSMGNRGDAEAVPTLAGLLNDTDAATVQAAASALARIATPAAADALRTARLKAPQALRAALADAHLACAERMLARGDKASAASIYKLFYAPGEPPAIRAAALRGQIAAQPTLANALIKEAIDAGVPELGLAVASVVREFPKVGDTRVIAGAALRLPPDIQAVVIRALADRGDKGALDTARRGLGHENAAMRMASIAALGRLGEDLDAAMLAELVLNTEHADERAAALDALCHLPGLGAEEALVGMLASEDASIRAGAAQALVNRPADEKVLELLQARDLSTGGDAASRPAGPPSYRWAQSETSIALMNGEQIVWRFNYDPKLPKAYFDPVNLPDGTELVWLCPPDHEWHFALWSSWVKINGLNYWEQWNVPGQGRMQITSVQARAKDDFSAEIDLVVSYHPDGKPAVLTERRTLRVFSPDEDGAYRISWTSAFIAGAQDVVLQGGTSGGGYAGLSVRMSPRTRDWQILDSEGRRDGAREGLAEHTHGRRARWMDFSVEGLLTHAAAGIAIFDHPRNPRHPATWFSIIDDRIPFGYFSPALLFGEPYTVPAGAELDLHYLILVHPGRPDAERLNREWQGFTDLP